MLVPTPALFAGSQCEAPVPRGLATPSFVRKAKLVRYVSAETEKSRNPPVMAIPNPIQFHTNNVSDSCNDAADFCLLLED